MDNRESSLHGSSLALLLSEVQGTWRRSGHPRTVQDFPSSKAWSESQFQKMDYGKQNPTHLGFGKIPQIVCFGWNEILAFSQSNPVGVSPRLGLPLKSPWSCPLIADEQSRHRLATRSEVSPPLAGTEPERKSISATARETSHRLNLGATTTGQVPVTTPAPVARKGVRPLNLLATVLAPRLLQQKSRSFTISSITFMVERRPR